MISKGRLDALTDGIFAFAMTVLVLDLHLPDDFAPTSTGELLNGLGAQSEHFFVFVLSFAVLGLRWIGQARIRAGTDEAGEAYSWWTLVHLFFIVLMPFSTIVVGRYGDLAPAIWLYAGNMIASSLVAWWLAILAKREGRKVDTSVAHLATSMLVISAVLSVVLSFVALDWAMYAYLLNLAGLFNRVWRRRAPG